MKDITPQRGLIKDKNLGSKLHQQAMDFRKCYLENIIDDMITTAKEFASKGETSVSIEMSDDRVDKNFNEVQKELQKLGFSFEKDKESSKYILSF